MFKIEIVSSQVVSRDITTKEGKKLTIHTQEAFLHGQHKYPQSFKINLESNVGYAPGFYLLRDDSCWIDKYGNLCFARYLRLASLSSTD